MSLSLTIYYIDNQLFKIFRSSQTLTEMKVFVWQVPVQQIQRDNWSPDREAGTTHIHEGVENQSEFNFGE